MRDSVRLDYKAYARLMVKDGEIELQGEYLNPQYRSASSLANWALAVHEMKIRLDLKHLLKIFDEYVPAITMSHKRQLIGI